MSIYGEIIQGVASDISTIGNSMQADQTAYREAYAEYLVDTSAPLDGKNQTANVIISMENYHSNQADNVIVVGTSSNNSFYNYSQGTNSVIFGEAGNDTISNLSDRAILLGGTGNDSINNDGDSVLLMGGAGNDTINVTAGDNVSVRGGNGDDYLRYYPFNGWDISKRTEAILYQYAEGDGNDTISNWSEGSKLYVEGDYTTSTVENGDMLDLVIHVGNGSITVKRRGGEYMRDTVLDNLVTVPSGTFSSAKDPVAPSVTTTSGSSSSTSTTTDNSSSSATSGTSSTNSGTFLGIGDNGPIYSTDNSVTATDSSTTSSSGGSSSSTVSTASNIYIGGDKVISNYTGQPVNMTAKYKGASFSGNNFVVNSSAGTLTIQNVVDKVVDLRNGAGNEFVKAYKASAAGIVDGRGISAYEIIEGSSAGMDVIFAGDGGSQLWGGSGTAADAIAGGYGTDIFIGGRYQGADVFYSASSADIVNLTDATLSDIVAAVEVNGNIALGFNTGNIITIQSTDTLSAAINLSDGSAWRYNHSAKSWQGA